LTDLIQWVSRESIVNANDTHDLLELIESGKFLIVAQELREQLGDTVLSRFITETFDPDAIIPSRVQEYISIVPFRGFVSTNYDNLWERAYVNVMRHQLRPVLADAHTSLEQLLKQNPFSLKLHDDLEIPSSIVLAYRDYLRLVSDPGFQALLDGIFSDFTVLMVGYGLTDLDIIQSLDRLTHAKKNRRHYLLSRCGTRNAVQRRRLLLDRNIQTIEYTDYFGFHNHIDTFLEGVIASLDLLDELKRVRPQLRRRMHVHYPQSCTVDGEFVWNYVFREGAVTLSAEAQTKQLEKLQESLERGLKALDYVVFLTDRVGFNDGTFRPLIERAIEVSRTAGAQVVFLMVGDKERPDQLLPAAVGCPAFYLLDKFGEKDPEPFRAYIAQDMRAGFRQD
jgi:SIR2-like domain